MGEEMTKNIRHMKESASGTFFYDCFMSLMIDHCQERMVVK